MGTDPWFRTSIAYRELTFDELEMEMGLSAGVNFSVRGEEQNKVFKFSYSSFNINQNKEKTLWVKEKKNILIPEETDLFVYRDLPYNKKVRLSVISRFKGVILLAF